MTEQTRPKSSWEIRAEAAEAEIARLRAALNDQAVEWERRAESLRDARLLTGDQIDRCADELSALLAPPEERDDVLTKDRLKTREINLLVDEVHGLKQAKEAAEAEITRLRAAVTHAHQFMVSLDDSGYWLISERDALCAELEALLAQPAVTERKGVE